MSYEVRTGTHRPRIVCVAAMLAASLPAAMAAGDVYPSTPDWISANPHYSTGAAFVDLDRDGGLDLVVADGNDIQRGRLNVYYNQGGSFPTVAPWQSADLGYNGHLDVADVNGDGWPDVAVAHLGRGSTVAPIAKLYLNNAGTLSSLPDWEAHVDGNAFGCAFGDVNNDGRPDLAVGTGWAYSPQRFYPNYVYVNVGGMLEATASWASSDQNHYQGVLWADADADGRLDLVGIGQGSEIQVYRNLGGVLETGAGWETADSADQDGIMVTCGDVDGDGRLDLLATDNDQLGGSGRFKQYLGLPGGFFETTYSWSYFDGYGSAIALADVDADGDLDLATGAWWDHTRLFMNTGSGLPTQPTWSSGVTSVVEKIVFGDVNPPCGREIVRRLYLPADGARQLFALPERHVQGLVGVWRDGAALGPDRYTFHREHGWLTVDTPPADALLVVYTVSGSRDMAVSNWDGDIGNYLYYSTVIDDCNDNGAPDGCDIEGGTSDDVNDNGIPDECECPGDVDGSGAVNFADILAVLGAWGPCFGCPADVDGSGVVDFADLLVILAEWGACP